MPPFKLAQMMAEAADKESPAYQRMTWDALRKSINGLVNKVRARELSSRRWHSRAHRRAVRLLRLPSRTHLARLVRQQAVHGPTLSRRV